MTATNKVKFSQDDDNAREVVRAIFFQFLKKETFNQLPYDISPFRTVVEFEGHPQTTENKFLLLLQEIFWELIIQQIITPGLNVSNPNLPFFRVTEYGKKVVSDDEFVAHDPSNYLLKYLALISKPDRVVVEYLKESLVNFSAGCFLSANMMLGIASERVFLNLCYILLNALKSPKEEKKFLKIMDWAQMNSKFEFVQNKFEYLINNKAKNFPRNIKTALFGIGEFLRYQRNDIGHPQDNLTIPTRDDVYVNLRLFPSYCKTIQLAEKYFKNHKV